MAFAFSGFKSMLKQMADTFTQTVVSPCIPYGGHVPGNVQDGRVILIKGICHHHHNEFSINISTSPQTEPLSDTALHFNIRFGENCVVRNTLQHGNWGQEERGGGLPFHKGRPFTIKILVEHHQFRVDVNGHHFTDYRHRMQLGAAQYLVIKGDIVINTIEFEDNHCHSAPAPSSHGGGGAVSLGRTIIHPKVPYICEIPGGATEGKIIIIKALNNLLHKRGFSINFSVSPQPEPLSDTALHFNVRFNEKCVVRNSLEHGSWRHEERGGGFPFKKGFSFVVKIIVEYNQYKILVDGKHFTTFQHRMPKESGRYLVIVGDISISTIDFKADYNSTSSHAPSAPAGSYPGAVPGPQYPTPGPPAGYYPGAAPAPAYPPAPQPSYYPTGPAPAPAYPPAPQPSYYPGPAPPAGPGSLQFGQPVYNPPVPYTVNIPGGVVPGRMLYISGVPHPNASRFTVNLLCGPSEEGDIGFHFDVRFNFGGAHNQTVRNHKSGRSWGSEQRHQSYFPFMASANFDMIILIEPSCIKVAVNNQHYCEFSHRIQPISRLDFLNVTGDVQVTSVRMQ